MAKTATKPKKTPGDAIALPGFRSGAIMPRTQVASGGSGDGFIWTAHKMSKLWDDIAGKVKGLQQGQFVYVASGHVERLQPMKFHLLEAFHFYADLDDNGEVETAYDEESDARPKTAKEIVEALILVYTDQGVRPARATFKNATVGAIAPMLKEFTDAGTPEWSKRSKDHELAAKAMNANEFRSYRFYGTASTTPKQTKDGKFTYSLGNCRVAPSTSSELSELKEIDKDCNTKLDTVRDAFLGRVSDIKSKM